MGASALGIAGLGMQFLGNQGAQKSANKAQGSQDALIQRQIQAYDQRFKIAKTMLDSGQFDPTKAIGAANDLSLQQQGTEQGNAAGASRVLGYKPGDSVPGQNQAAIGEKYRASRAANNFNIASSLRSQELNAFDPSSASVLNSGIQTYGQQQQNALGQIQPLGSSIAALAPYFQKQPKKGFALYG